MDNRIAVNYRYNSKNEVVIQDICEFILGKEYGTMIYFTDITRRIGLNIESEESMKLFKRLMAKVKNIMIDHSYILKSVGGKGYYILKPNQIPNFTYRNYILKPQKAYQKAKRILERTNRTRFENIDKENYNDVNELNNQMIQVSDYTIFNSSYYNNMSKYKQNDIKF